MKKSRLSRTFTFSMVFILGAMGLFAAETDDPATASVYFERAEAFYASGKLDACAEMISSSLEFFPSNSEALYLRAIIDLQSQEKTREGIDSLRRAIAGNSWSKTDPDLARQKLAEALLRTGALEETVGILQRLVSSRPEDPANAALLAVAYEKMGLLDSAAKTAAEALARFPKNEALYLLSSRFAELMGKSEAARAAAASGLRELPDSLPLLLRASELEPDPERRLKALDEYAVRGGKDPLAAVIALEAGAKDPGRYVDAFVSEAGLNRLDLTRRVSAAIARSKELAASFSAELGRFTGTRDLAWDGSAFTTERWEYGDGKPVKWLRDSNTDGVPEFTAEFTGGLVSSLTIPSADGGLTLHFEEYPFLDQATVRDRSGSRTFHLTPRVLGCFLLGASALPSDAAVSPRFFVPTTAHILAAAFLEEDFTVDGTLPLRRIDLSSGKKLYMEEDLSEDGRMDHKVWFENGKPVRGLRDIASRGEFTTTETYRDGKLWKSAADTDADGKVDYAEQFDGAHVKTWDYNQDGAWDSREYTGDNGTTIREFSTALDGSFDLRITFKNTIILSVQRGGKKIPVSTGPQDGVVWIGTRQKDAKVDLNAREGVAFFGGLPYLIFRFHDTVYIEELR